MTGSSSSSSRSFCAWAPRSEVGLGSSRFTCRTRRWHAEGLGMGYEVATIGVLLSCLSRREMMSIRY